MLWPQILDNRQILIRYLIPNVIDGLVLCIRDYPRIGVPANEVGIDQANITVKQPLCTLAALVHGMVKHLINQGADILLPQPCTVKQDAVNLP